jgi:tetratricopeptide (TPR) repeat protein
MIIIPATLWSAVQAGSGFLEKAARGTALMNLEDLPRASYLFTQFRVIVTYLRILLWPVGLNFDHDYPIFHSFFSAPVVASAAGLALLLAMGGYLLARSRRIDGPCSANHRLGAFGIFFFFLTLSMSSSLIPINDVINEYRVYLPSVGIFLLAASSADSLVRSFGPRGTGVARAAAVAATAVLCLLAGATVARNRVWRDDAGFWQDAWRKSPGKARVASQLAGAYLMQGRTEDAIEILRELIRVKPELAQAHYTLGEMFMAQGRIDDAVAAFERAKAIQSDRPEIYAWLARAYLFQGRLDLSAEALGSLERYEPGSPVLGLMRARLSGSGIAP